jgi:predicted ATPase
LAARLYSDAPKVHLLTTSRESLRVEGEHDHLLAPLDYPAARDGLTAAEALASPAVQLFMEHAFASDRSCTRKYSQIIAFVREMGVAEPERFCMPIPGEYA